MGTHSSDRSPIQPVAPDPGRRPAAGEFWHLAPPGSHLESFKLVDARLRRQTDRADAAGGGRLADAVGFLGELWPRRRRAEPHGGADEPNSSLFVRFVDGSEYEYFTADHDYLESVYALMCNARRPGEIVWSHLIARQVPCRRS